MNGKISLLLLVILISCNNGPKPTVVSEPRAMPVEKDSVVSKKIVLKESDLANKKDLVCGMPAFHYLNDTAVYKGKTYGFCSKDCKDEFLKDPAAYLVKK